MLPVQDVQIQFNIIFFYICSYLKPHWVTPLRDVNNNKEQIFLNEQGPLNRYKYRVPDLEAFTNNIMTDKAIQETVHVVNYITV